MTRSAGLAGLTLASVILPLTLLTPTHARACGGFFCSQTPVVQVGERIVFAFEDGRPVTYVELSYRGTDPSFAWVIPVPEPPEIEVGVGQGMFDALDQQTQPIILGPTALASPASAFADGASCGGGGSDGPSSLEARFVPVPEVEVLQSARVGPYEYVTLDAEDPFDLNTWLLVNGYRVQPGSDAIVGAYLDEGMKLLALKLAPDATATEVEPLKLRYAESDGCTIPIRLTAIASTPALQIVVWVFGDSRAYPTSYREVTVDPLNLRGPLDYGPELARVVDEAGGHAFVTEYARASVFLDDRGDPTLAKLIAENAYVTRLHTELDPEEMTIDPTFETRLGGEDVSNQLVAGRPIAMGGGSMLALLGLGLVVARRRRAS